MPCGCYRAFFTTGVYDCTKHTLCSGRISAIFGEDLRYDRRRVGLGWVNTDDHNDFMEYIEDQRSKGRHVFSIACDDHFGFGLLTMDDFGTTQGVAWDSDMSTVQEWFDAGYHITACGARNSQFYYIMTRGAMGYDGKKQTCTLKDSWGEAEDYIRQQWEKGYVLTGICYSTGKKQYFLVMTQSSEGQTQSHNWGTTSQAVDFNWVEEECRMGREPTIIFHDPSDNLVLVVTTSDRNRSGSSIRPKHGLII